MRGEGGYFQASQPRAHLQVSDARGCLRQVCLARGHARAPVRLAAPLRLGLAQRRRQPLLQGGHAPRGLARDAPRGGQRRARPEPAWIREREETT